MSKKGKETPDAQAAQATAPAKSGNWSVLYLPEVEKDFQGLGPSQRVLVRKAIAKVAQNPVPAQEGGYGKTLGSDLAGFLKIKLRGAGLRVVYQLVRTENGMLIVVVGARADDEVYDIAKARAKKHNL